MARTTRLVLGIPLYTAIAIIAALASLSLFVLSRNIDLLLNVVLSGGLPVQNRLLVLLGQYPGLGNAYTTGQSAVLLVTAALVGIDISLVTYHLRENTLSMSEGGGGVIGVVLGTLGAGCASCGTAILAGLLSLFGLGGVLTALPLDGLELAFLAIVTLILSIYWISKGMRGASIRGCPVDL